MKLADLSSRKAGAVPFRFEYLLPDGSGSGLFLSVYGDNAAPVVEMRNRLVDEHNQRVAQVQAMAKPGDPPVVEAYATTQTNNNRLDAARIAGWEGVEHAFSYEAAMALLDESPEVREQVVAKSKALGNFLKPSKKSS